MPFLAVGNCIIIILEISQAYGPGRQDPLYGQSTAVILN